MSTYTDFGPVLVSELPAVRVASRPSALARVLASVAARREERREQRRLDQAMALGHAEQHELLALSRRG